MEEKEQKMTWPLGNVTADVMCVEVQSGENDKGSVPFCCNVFRPWMPLQTVWEENEIEATSLQQELRMCKLLSRRSPSNADLCQYF